MSVLWQNAPAIALENGCYDGLTTVAEVKAHGTLGVGAFDHLDGEMVMVDGEVHRMLSDGSAAPAADDDTLPFCMVVPFEPELTRELPDGCSKADLARHLDEMAGTENLFVAVRVHGTFGALRTRSLPRQTPPYPPMTAVTADQPEFAYDELAGVMVGFSAPSYAGRIAPGGHHLHLVDDARRVGGHVLDFTGGRDVVVALQRIVRHEVDYPATDAFLHRRLT